MLTSLRSSSLSSVKFLSPHSISLDTILSLQSSAGTSNRYEYKTHAKDRWFGRELVEIFTTEFRDRTKEYYVRSFDPLLSSLPSRFAMTDT